MDQMTRFFKNKSESLQAKVNLLEATIKNLTEAEAPATVFKGTGSGQQAFSNAELEDQMRRTKRGGLFQKVSDEDQTQEYKDAKAELNRRSGQRSGSSDRVEIASDSWVNRLNVPPEEKEELEAMRLGVTKLLTSPTANPADQFKHVNTYDVVGKHKAADVAKMGRELYADTKDVPSVDTAISAANSTAKPSAKPSAKPTAKPASVSTPVPEFDVAAERAKSVRSMVKGAFGDVGIAAPGINAEGPAVPYNKPIKPEVKQGSNTTSYFQQKLDDLLMRGMRSGSRSRIDTDAVAGVNVEGPAVPTQEKIPELLPVPKPISAPMPVPDMVPEPEPMPVPDMVPEPQDVTKTTSYFQKQFDKTLPKGSKSKRPVTTIVSDEGRTVATSPKETEKEMKDMELPGGSMTMPKPTSNNSSPTGLDVNELIKQLKSLGQTDTEGTMNAPLSLPDEEQEAPKKQKDIREILKKYGWVS
jgi:hypothetical protein